MIKLPRRLTAAIVAAVLVFTASSGYTENGNTTQNADTANAASQDAAQQLPVQQTATAQGSDSLKDMEVAAENEYLVLYINKKTTEVAVKDKSNNAVWFSNPQQRDSDSAANGTNKALLSSQMTITTKTDADQNTTYNSYEHSVAKEQFKIEKTDHGVKVIYDFSNFKRGVDEFPKFISKERYEKIFLSKITDKKELEILNKHFVPYDKNPNVMRVYTPKPMYLDKLIEIKDRVGYTSADLAKDTVENEAIEKGLGGTLRQLMDFGETKVDLKHLIYSVPLVYTLDKANLVVSIPANEIKYTKEVPIAAIRLLEFFGAADNKDTGYMFVPDGSGALVNVNNGKSHYAQVNIPVYGADYTASPGEKNLVSQQVNMPVFGIKTSDKAFLAIIEKGDPYASISAKVSGMGSSYNSVSSEFTFVQRGKLGGGWAKNTGVFNKAPYAGEYKIRYSFLYGENANYVGMAKEYQKYLVDGGMLKKLEGQDSLPFYAEVVGGIDKNKSFLGFPIRTIESLTTFDQALEIVKKLKEADVNNINLRYSGWFNGSTNHSLPSSVNISRKLGGSSDFKNLAKYMKDNAMGFFPDVSFVNVYKEGKGFNLNRDAMRFISNEIAIVQRYDMATTMVNAVSPYITLPNYSYLLSPARLGYVVDKFLKSYVKYEATGLSSADLGQTITSDFRKDTVVDRQKAADISRQQLQKIRDTVGEVMVENGTMISFPYASHVVGAPLTNSAFNIEDASIPFYQMVLHGYVNYAGDPINLSDDYNVQILKSIETGANLYYKWIFEYNSLVKDTVANDLYTTHYNIWLKEAATIYQSLNAELGDTTNQAIINHEKLQENVYQVTYENGKSVIVNYNEAAVNISGVNIDGLGYKVLKGVN